MLPSQFLSLPTNEQAFVYAAIQIRTENEEKEAKKIKAKSKSKGRMR